MDETKDIYEQSIRHLPVMERLRLAAFILNGVAIPRASDLNIDQNDETDEEATDLAAFFLKHAGRNIPLRDDKGR